ncbi:hypothetical protein PSACC_03567 [Paramicrosporidium saccamoebae]|uniref:Uncharacterized protein n=1 Tax=Paramicrosporidium saccamoebae TaxID=1246581 RepID=A0A2H9TFP2_9FUNG|nr:hypothetical protein PSACC_03567 [Paramicrosporidium saccamoebae]
MLFLLLLHSVAALSITFEPHTLARDTPARSIGLVFKTFRINPKNLKTVADILLYDGFHYGHHFNVLESVNRWSQYQFYVGYTELHGTIFSPPKLACNPPLEFSPTKGYTGAIFGPYNYPPEMDFDPGALRQMLKYGITHQVSDMQSLSLFEQFIGMSRTKEAQWLLRRLTAREVFPELLAIFLEGCKNTILSSYLHQDLEPDERLIRHLNVHLAKFSHKGILTRRKKNRLEESSFFLDSNGPHFKLNTIARRLLAYTNNNCSHRDSAAQATDFGELFEGLKTYASDTRAYWGMMITLIAESFVMKSVSTEQPNDAVNWLLSKDTQFFPILPMKLLVSRMPQLADKVSSRYFPITQCELLPRMRHWMEAKVIQVTKDSIDSEARSVEEMKWLFLDHINVGVWPVNLYCSRNGNLMDWTIERANCILESDIFDNMSQSCLQSYDLVEEAMILVFGVIPYLLFERRRVNLEKFLPFQLKTWSDVFTHLKTMCDGDPRLATQAQEVLSLSLISDYFSLDEIRTLIG